MALLNDGMIWFNTEGSFGVSSLYFLPYLCNADYDKARKEALNEYFEEFLSFFFPQIHALVDWSITPIALDKELQQLKADYPPDLRIADKFYQV